ncbi:hypothetical protein D3C71_1234770 [compost metagenome]
MLHSVGLSGDKITACISPFWGCTANGAEEDIEDAKIVAGFLEADLDDRNRFCCNDRSGRRKHGIRHFPEVDPRNIGARLHVERLAGVCGAGMARYECLTVARTDADINRGGERTRVDHLGNWAEVAGTDDATDQRRDDIAEIQADYRIQKSDERRDCSCHSRAELTDDIGQIAQIHRYQRSNLRGSHINLVRIIDASTGPRTRGNEIRITYRRDLRRLDDFEFHAGSDPRQGRNIQSDRSSILTTCQLDNAAD